jgi:hypothetical protein
LIVYDALMSYTELMCQFIVHIASLTVSDNIRELEDCSGHYPNLRKLHEWWKQDQGAG